MKQTAQPPIQVSLLEERGIVEEMPVLRISRRVDRIRQIQEQVSREQRAVRTAGAEDLHPDFAEFLVGIQDVAGVIVAILQGLQLKGVDRVVIHECQGFRQCRNRIAALVFVSEDGLELKPGPAQELIDSFQEFGRQDVLVRCEKIRRADHIGIGHIETVHAHLCQLRVARLVKNLADAVCKSEEGDVGLTDQ